MSSSDAQKPGVWDFLSKATALWTAGTIVVSVAGGLIAAALYVSGLLSRIDALEKQVAELEKLPPRVDRLEKRADAFNQALFPIFERAARKNVIFNGPEDGPTAPKCGNGSVLMGVRIDEVAIGHGQIDCINLKPTEVP